MEHVILTATIAFKTICMLGIGCLTLAIVFSMAAALGYLFYFMFGERPQTDKDVDCIEVPSSKKSKTVLPPKKKPIGRNERTSSKVASKASELLSDPKTSKKVKSVAASALTQAPDKARSNKPKKTTKGNS